MASPILSPGYPGQLSTEQAAQYSFIEKKRGGIVVFTNGVFDLLHRGHLEYLREARALGNVLLVGLNSDESVKKIKGDKRPLVSQEDRLFALLSLRFVDHVIVFDEETPERIISLIQPSILVKGGDYQAENVVGFKQVTENGGRVEIIPLREGYSTTHLIERIHLRYR